MKPKILFVSFLSVFLIATLAFSTHVFSQKITNEIDMGLSVTKPTISPGFPPTGEYDPSDSADVSEISVLPPINAAENSSNTTSSAIKNETTTEPVFSVASGSNEVNVSTAAAPQSSLSEQLVIPSLNLKVSIAGVGLTPAGDMDVLNDPTKVSWYKNGTVPGNLGSAVIGAHVFQAFAKLEKLKLGDDIYIEHLDGSRLHFVVSDEEIYPYGATEPLPKIFNRSDVPRLNLITCYGKLTADSSTYDHRLVVFTELKG